MGGDNEEVLLPSGKRTGQTQGSNPITSNYQGEPTVISEKGIINSLKRAK
jgi:hypothetical protein